MIPEHISESVTYTKLPNCVEKFDISVVEYNAMKRFHGEVGCEPVLKPKLYQDTIVCYKNCTKRRYLSRTYYEPKLKPKVFKETVVIYPKRPEKIFVAVLDYHIDECRKWFKTSLEFKARTYTTSKIMKDSAYESDLDSSSEEEDNIDDKKDVENDGKEFKSVSQIYLPRFEKWESSTGNDDSSHVDTTGNDDFSYLESQIQQTGSTDESETEC